MARTRAVLRWRPNINFNAQRQAAAIRQMAEMDQEQQARPDVDSQTQRVARRRIRASDVKIKFLLPRVKDVEVKHRGNVVRKMKVRRVAKHGAKKRNVRYG